MIRAVPVQNSFVYLYNIPGSKLMSLTTIRSLLVAVGVSGVQILAPSSAEAQATASTVAHNNEQLGLEEIVVTARKREERVQDIPASITVLDSNAIEAAGVNSFEDMTRLIPNFTIHENYRSGQPFLTMRGIPTAQGGEPPVAVLIDGVQQPSLEFVQQGLYDVADVQVLRGPQGALYGRGAIAGAVLIDTKRPDDNFEARADAFYGNGDTYRLASTLSGPIEIGKLWFRLTGGYRDTSGFNSYVLYPSRNADASHEATGRLELLAQPLDDLSIALRGSHTVGADGASDYQLVTNSQLNDYSVKNPQDYPIVDRRKLDNVSLKVDWNIGAATVTSISQYAKTTSYVIGDADFGPLPLFEQIQHAEVVAINEDLRLTSNQTGPLQWLVGAFFQHRNSPTNLTVQTVQHNQAGLPDFFPVFVSDDFEQSRSYAAYGQAIHHFADLYEVTAALRYDSDRRFGKDLGSGGAASHTFSAWQPTVTLKRDLWHGAQGYMTYGEGFRSGGFNALADVKVTGNSLLYPKETSRNFEVGVKSEWLDRRLAINLSVFRMNFDNQQFFYVISSPPSRNIVSFPKTHINGSELEIQARPVGGLTLTAGLGVSDSIIDVSNEGGLYNGNHSPLSNRYTFNLSGDYRHALFGSVSGLIRIDYDGLGRVYWDQVNDVSQGPVQTLGARVGIEAGGWTLSAVGKNLTDRRYAELVSTNFSAGPIQGRIPNLPRTYGVELTAKF